MLSLLLWVLAGCSDPEAQYQRAMADAQLMIEGGQYENAIDLLNRLSEKYPARAEIVKSIGDVYEASGEPFFAALFYVDAAQADSEYGEYLYSAAILFDRAEETDEALSAVTDYLELYPDDSEAWRFSAGLLARESQVQAALSAHLRAERQDGPSRNPDYAAEMGQLYLLAGNPAQADAYFISAAENSPVDRLPAMLGQLTIAYQGEDFGRAEGLISDLDEEFPGALEASALASAREQVKLWRVTQDAIAEELARLEAQEAQRAAELEATQLDAEEPAEETGNSGSNGNDGVETIEGTVAGGKLQPLDTSEDEPEPPSPPPPPLPPPTNIELAEAALLAGESDDAVRYYWKAVRVDGDDPEVWAGLSRASLLAGDAETAEIAILEARRRDPEDLRFLLSYLDVIQVSRSRERFREELEKAYERIPNSPDLVLSMARANAGSNGNSVNAAFFYRKFLEMSPDHPEAVAARREMNALP